MSILAASQMIISRRLATRSTTRPAGSATSRKHAVAAAASNPTSNVVACKRTTATSGSATIVTADPISLIACPVHSSMKSRCRHKLQRTAWMPDASAAGVMGSIMSPSAQMAEMITPASRLGRKLVAEVGDDLASLFVTNLDEVLFRAPVLMLNEDRRAPPAHVPLQALVFPADVVLKTTQQAGRTINGRAVAENRIEGDLASHLTPS